MIPRSNKIKHILHIYFNLEYNYASIIYFKIARPKE